MKTKLEQSQGQYLLLNFDALSISEVKTPLMASFLGYVSFRRVGKGSSHRGGTVVIFTNSLSSLVTSDAQVWLTFQFSSKLLFGFCYVLPSDSKYYSDASFACIQGKLKMKTASLADESCITGDLNVRFGDCSLRS